MNIFLQTPNRPHNCVAKWGLGSSQGPNIWKWEKMLNKPKPQPVCSHSSLDPAPELRLNRRALSVGQVSLSNTFPSGLGPTWIPICVPLNTVRALCRGGAGSLLEQLARALPGALRAALSGRLRGWERGRGCNLTLPQTGTEWEHALRNPLTPLLH